MSSYYVRGYVIRNEMVERKVYASRENAEQRAACLQLGNRERLTVERVEVECVEVDGIVYAPWSWVAAW